MATRKTTDTVQLKVRLREWLRADLEAKAKKNRVSLNQEIVNRLADSLAVDRTDEFFERVHVAEKAILDLESQLKKVGADIGKVSKK